ncbi:hypothetical protein M0R04_11830 [Candidatus Dojkabacteria bacterium]|nr:hypothetical protein [Candidatus Dojkabacteria bacterium]
MNESTKFYLETIQRELERLEQGKFTGNVEFQCNFKDGSIANLNVTLRRSIKRIE